MRFYWFRWYLYRVIGDDWGYLKGMVWFSFRCRIGKEVDWLEFREWFESDGWNWKFGNCR